MINFFKRLFKKDDDSLSLTPSNVDIQNMTIDEYNKWLHKNMKQKLAQDKFIKMNQFENAKKYLNDILDKAFKQYITDCKKHEIFIESNFIVCENEYNITAEMIASFKGKKSIKIGNYKIKFVQPGEFEMSLYGSIFQKFKKPYLIVEAFKK